MLRSRGSTKKKLRKLSEDDLYNAILATQHREFKVEYKPQPKVRTKKAKKKVSRVYLPFHCLQTHMLIFHIKATFT